MWTWCCCQVVLWSHREVWEYECISTLCSCVARHIFPRLDPSQGGFRWGCRRHGLQSRGFLAPPRTLLPRLLTSERLLTPAELKPLWFVSSMSLSRVVCGTYLQISSVSPCPKSFWVALSLHHGLWLRASHDSLPFISSCLSTV